MMERITAAALACCCTAALIGCIPAVQQAALSDTGVAPERDLVHIMEEERGTPVARSQDIEGQWDIVSFDGYEPRRLTGGNRAAFADFGPLGVSLQIECNQSGAGGRVVDGVFRDSGRDIPQTLVGCGPDREARDAALFAFFRAAPSVERLVDGRLLLRTSDSALLLQRPHERRLAFLPTGDELFGEWRLLSLTRMTDGNGYAGIGLSEIPGRIVFTDKRAGYSRCPQYDFGYAYDAEQGRLSKLTRDALPPRPIDCAELADRDLGGPDMPEVWDAMRVLHGNPLVEKSSDGDLLLSSGDIGLLLTRKPCVSVEQSDDHSETTEIDCASPR